MKLHFMANPGLLRPESKKDEKVGIWVERGNSWEWGFWRKDKVAKYYMDVGLSGQPHQVCLLSDSGSWTYCCMNIADVPNSVA